MSVHVLTKKRVTERETMAKRRVLLEPKKGLLYGYFAPLFTIIVLLVIMGISFFGFYYGTKDDITQDIAAEIKQLSSIFERIDERCHILGFQDQKNPINFLTIKKDGFVGSEVGSMSLAHPQHWQGPYVERNLDVQGIEYQIVKTNKGYFITPGDGVTLPNGAVVGKDFILDEGADIDAMMRDESQLSYAGTQFAAPLRIHELEQNALILPEDLATAQQEWVKQQAHA
jgi:hypothetical protein